MPAHPSVKDHAEYKDFKGECVKKEGEIWINLPNQAEVKHIGSAEKRQQDKNHLAKFNPNKDRFAFVTGTVADAGIVDGGVPNGLRFKQHKQSDKSMQRKNQTLETAQKNRFKQGLLDFNSPSSNMEIPA